MSENRLEGGLPRELNSAVPQNSFSLSGAERGVTLRRAVREEDLALVQGVVQAYHDESRFAHIPFSARKFSRMYIKAISQLERTIVLYAWYKGRAIGVIHSTIGEYYLGDGGRFATILGIYVSRDVRSSVLGGRVAIRLLRSASEWAKNQGAEEITLYATSGLRARSVDGTLRRLGFLTLGGSYFALLGSRET